MGITKDKAPAIADTPAPTPAAVDPAMFTPETLALKLKELGLNDHRALNKTAAQMNKVGTIIRTYTDANPAAFAKYVRVENGQVTGRNLNLLVNDILPAEQEFGMSGTGLSKHTIDPFQWQDPDPKEGETFGEGGIIKPVASNAGIAVGQTHEEGGIKIGKNEVENNETLVNDGKDIKVYSDKRGYADQANKLVAEKGQLEKAIEGIDSKLDNLFNQQENSFADGGKFPVPDEFPINGTPEEQRAWMWDYPDPVADIKATPDPVSFSEKVKTDANSKATSELVNSVKEYSYKEPVKVVPKPTYHEQLLSLVEELKPTPDKKQETNLKRAAKYQAIADFVSVLGDSFYGAKGAKINPREPGVTGSLKALQDYYDKLASGEATYRSTKIGLLSKLADKADAKDALAEGRTYQEGRDKLKADAEDERFKAKIAADEKALGRKLTAAEKIAAKRLAAQKKDKPDKGATRYGVISDGKEYGLTAAQVSNVVGEFTKKYTGILTNKDAKTPFPTELLPVLKQLLQGGMLSNMGQQMELINRFAKYDPAMKSLIQSYGGETSTTPKQDDTAPIAPDYSMPGSNEAYVSPGQAALTEEELQSKIDNLDFNF